MDLQATMTTIDDIRDNFELLEEWDDRYRYVIELGRTARADAGGRAFRREQGQWLRQPGLAVAARSTAAATATPRAAVISATATPISCAA